MSEYDLSPLEQAAARVGLPGRSARVVPPDPRRSTWFRWTDTELLVSERVLERLRPDEASVLLIHAVHERRRLDATRRRGLTLVAAVAAVVVATAFAGGWPFHLALALLVVSLAGALGARNRSRFLADDDTVAFLGEADTLVRALNVIHQDEVRVAGRSWNARPDIHARAERLVTRHQLRLAPEQRSCAPIARADEAAD